MISVGNLAHIFVVLLSSVIIGSSAVGQVTALPPISDAEKAVQNEDDARQRRVDSERKKAAARAKVEQTRPPESAIPNASIGATAATEKKIGPGMEPSIDTGQIISREWNGYQWVCPRGARLISGSCKRVVVPLYGMLDYSGQDWVCQRGYRRSGRECTWVSMPEHAQLDYTGQEWVCKERYMRVGNQCVLQ